MKASRSNLSRSGFEPRRLGNVVLVALMLGSVLALSLIRARFAPRGKEADTAAVENDAAAAKISGDDPAAAEMEDEVVEDQPKSPVTEMVADAAGGGKAVCYETSRRSDTCEASGDVRVHGAAQTVFASAAEQEWRIKPYCRKHDAFAQSHVKEWTLKPLAGAGTGACTVNSSATAFVFSNGGFTGNLFHDYTDVLIPLFISTNHLAGDVQFLVSSLKPWWINRYASIFQQLSKHEIIDIDGDGAGEIRCFPRIILGPTFHKELGVDAGKTPGGASMVDFKRMLRNAFGLPRATATPSGDQWDIRRKPRLLIISRKNSRAFLNERAMVDMAMSLGFDVRVGEPDINTDVGKFARLVNSADVMVGAHGAGLTNMVFLPAGAVLIQVVPFGGLEWLARGTFKEPADEMQVHYLEYIIQLDETTLGEQYSPEDPVIKDPYAVHKRGWEALKTAYLDKQNLKPHLGRLKNTFQEALKLLPHGRAN